MTAAALWKKCLIQIPPHRLSRFYQEVEEEAGAALAFKASEEMKKSEKHKKNKVLVHCHQEVFCCRYCCCGSCCWRYLKKTSAIGYASTNRTSRR
jgi:hypothetical protein